MRLLPLKPGFRWVRRHPWLTGVVRVTCVAAGVGVYYSARTSRAERHWQQAEQAVADRDFERVQSELAAFLEIRPKSAEAHLLLAQAFRRARREDFDQAE